MLSNLSTTKKLNTQKTVNSMCILSSQADLSAETPYLDSVYFSQVGVIQDVVNMIINYYAAAVMQAPGNAYLSTRCSFAQSLYVAICTEITICTALTNDILTSGSRTMQYIMRRFTV